MHPGTMLCTLGSVADGGVSVRAAYGSVKVVRLLLILQMLLLYNLYDQSYPPHTTIER